MVDQGSVEKKLALTYILCTAAGAIASITSGIAWGHWKQTLDQCVGRNCTCILYGEHTYNIFLGNLNRANWDASKKLQYFLFLGGDASSCIWVTFGPLIYILFTIGLSVFHGYRVLFSMKKTRTRTIMSKNE